MHPLKGAAPVRVVPGRGGARRDPRASSTVRRAARVRGRVGVRPAVTTVARRPKCGLLDSQRARGHAPRRR